MALWVRSMPACAALSEAISSLTTGQIKERSQTDVTSSRQERDPRDMNILYMFFLEKDPFQADTTL